MYQPQNEALLDQLFNISTPELKLELLRDLLTEREYNEFRLLHSIYTTARAEVSE